MSKAVYLAIGFLAGFLITAIECHYSEQKVQLCDDGDYK